MNTKTDVEAAAILFALAKIRKLEMNFSNNAWQKQTKDQMNAMKIVEPRLTVLKDALQASGKK
jgi:hypothetical protein